MRMEYSLEKNVSISSGRMSASDSVSLPRLALVFFSFRIMVGLGMLFTLLFILSLWYAKKRKFEKFKLIPYLALVCVPLAYVASQCGWIVAEVGANLGSYRI